MKERLKHTGDLLQIDKNQFMKIPLFVPENIQIFETLVDEIMTLKEKGKDTQKLEDKIDTMVYKLYGLSDDDVNVINASINSQE
jgi:adenine-specific DNA-methyltransferase